MRKILFVCHGNICRSQMAQSMAQYMVNKKGLADEFYFDSAATSTEEIGSHMYPPAERMLRSVNIPVIRHRARQITLSDLRKFDEIYYMDSYNKRFLDKMFAPEDLKKVRPILNRDIADPWYSDNFKATYDDLLEALTNILNIE